MSGTNSATSANDVCGALTRRSFLKAAGATAGAVGLAGAAGMTSTSGWLKPAQAHAAEEEKTVYTLHQFMCTGRCSLKCTVREGRLAKVEPNDTVEPYYRHCCMKGISEIQHVYSDDRLQQPMKRTGERGSNEFVAITWDEALEIVGEELQKAWGKYGHETVYVSSSNEPRFGQLAALLGAATGVEPGIDRGTGNGSAPAINGDVFGGGTNESRDWVNTKTLIIAGTNLLESSMMQANAFLDAKEAGCDIIVLDPHFSTTAGKANQWVPIKPGTDAAFYLGMITYIVENKLYDEDYMRLHTTFPLLVDETTGVLLRSDASDAASFMVWDSARGAAVSHTEAGATTALEGTFTVNGASCITLLDLLKKNQKQYSTAWAEGTCGVDQATIEEIARKYATAGPAYLAMGQGGSDKYSNPDIIGHAGMVLTALTGNIGKPGAGYGHCIGGAGWGVDIPAWPLPDEFTSPELPVRADRFPIQQNDVHVIISLGNTFQQYWANSHAITDWINGLDFILHIGMYYEDSVRFADVVLPVCSKFEDTVEHSIVRSDYNHVNLQTKCIDPLFESKPDFDVMRLIAQSVGLEQHLPENAEDMVRWQIENSDDLKEQGITLEALMENHGSIKMAGTDEPRRAFTDLEFDTPTGKMEIYYEDVLSTGQAWPNWEENNEVYDGNPLMEKYPLQFTQTRTRFSNHSHFKAATWLQQLRGTYVELNPVDMESRGLSDGDVIEGFNDRGSFKCPVFANEAVRPGTARTLEAGWSKHMVEGNTQNVTNDHINPRDEFLPTGAPIPFNDTLIEVKKA
ncbi:MAG: molybdopterin-dependent oxidoreductase [Eggerthellaceae bacterium]|nr:molybdopterin-dependent oxidoreductase [Eggerthellaceae bacterium]